MGIVKTLNFIIQNKKREERSSGRENGKKLTLLDSSFLNYMARVKWIFGHDLKFWYWYRYPPIVFSINIDNISRQ